MCIGLREVIALGLGWVPGDGRLISFWTDRWLMEKPLSEWLLAHLPEAEREKRVEDYWLDVVGWDMGRIGLYLPDQIIHRLYAMVIKGVPGMGDTLSWKGNANGEFTVRSAYSVLSGEDVSKQCMERFFEKIWRVLAPERVRVFFWLVTHQVVLTYVERARRHLSDSAVCQVC